MRPTSSISARYPGRRVVSPHDAQNGKSPRCVPAPLLKGAARLDRLVRRGKAKLTPDRARYFSHPDWVAAAERRPPASLWAPQIHTPTGLKATAQWYLEQGWLR